MQGCKILSLFLGGWKKVEPLEPVESHQEFHPVVLEGVSKTGSTSSTGSTPFTAVTLPLTAEELGRIAWG